MENASKALLMAGGILIGILILALMTTLFITSNQVTTRYAYTKNEEAIQQFNVNFTKYLGQDLTIHEVVTICNFANRESNKVIEVEVTAGGLTSQNIKDIVAQYTKEEDSITKYRIIINNYSEDGYINSISFSQIM